MAAAGSLLGVAINRDAWSFPVGKVEMLNMAPLDFEEYLWARDGKSLADSIHAAFDISAPLAPGLHEKALGLYREYLIVGEMPEAVQTLVDTGSVIDVAEKHRIILDGKGTHACAASRARAAKAQLAAVRRHAPLQP